MPVFNPHRLTDSERQSRREEVRQHLDVIAEKKFELKKLRAAKSQIVSHQDQDRAKLDDLDRQRAEVTVRGETPDAKLDKATETLKGKIADFERSRKIIDGQIKELAEEVKEWTRLKLSYQKLATTELLDRQWLLSRLLSQAAAQLKEAEAWVQKYEVLDPEQFHAEANAAHKDKLRRFRLAADRATDDLGRLRSEAAEVQALIEYK